MIENSKCECGHQNPVGTVLCESCGKPLFEDSQNDADTPLEMRYDGVARRSQKEDPAIIDRIWSFFSSVKIAIILIFLTLVGASLGTIFVQESTLINLKTTEEFADYYEETYGTAGLIYHALGLSRTYESWWFVGLLVMIGTSLVICSLDRVLPLYRALSKQQIRKHLQFITRQQVVYTGRIEQEPEAWVAAAAQQLKRKRYRVWQEGSALLAEKNRFSRWGPYINHIGLIVFLLAVLARGIPGWHMDQYVSLYEGEREPIPGTNYYVQSDKFNLQLYKDEELADNQKGTNVVKLYETKAKLFECIDVCDDPTKEPVLRQVQQHAIHVNSPLQYKGLKLYQNSYRQHIRLISVHPSLMDTATGKSFGSFDLMMDNPKLTYDVGPYKIRLSDYYPDFGFDDQKRPMTKSREPNNPAFIFRVSGPGITGEEVYSYFPLPNASSKDFQESLNAAFKEAGANTGRFTFKVANMFQQGKMEGVKYSEFSTFLNVRVDRAMPYIWVGAAISMIGLIMGFYWQHRRIWLRIDDGMLSLGAHTNKNSYGLRADVASTLGKTGITVTPKELDNRRNVR
ncbi:cytochrome C biogenesis protein ResB [Cohnella kolymensis]|uniref:Cytochrome C biogenesis protein ResB n=1 Tax=Cohnella kolymensis TaxID=1590652 RepID=A0ABR5A2V5_9BACL|nr:cytochrome c biogenesis protein ResB [Cohnella kolymensis]KIL34870.1 cytochrome C biogenesis protein ResB [Cohnella kolymensis]